MLAKLPVAPLAVPRFGCEELQRAVWVKWCPVPLFQFWLIVKCIDLTHPTGAEDLNHAVCLWHMVRLRSPLTSQ